MANFFLAFEQDLAIVPVLNKADLPSADPEATAAQMQQASRRCLDPTCGVKVSAVSSLLLHGATCGLRAGFTELSHIYPCGKRSLCCRLHS